MSKDNLDLNANYTNKYGFHVDNSAYVYKAQKGINEDVVKNISKMKQEPSWMTEFRLKSYRLFLQKEMPTWGGNLADINFENIYYYLKPTDKEQKRWEDVPKEMKETFDRLGIPEAEKKHLAGVKAQFESEVIYGSLLAELEEQGVIFLGTDDALKKYPHFFEEYFGKIIPPHDNKFAALNSAVWSGGSFVYIPKGVHVKRPLQAYFRINAMNMGQFERTLIIADEGSFAHYVEGCFTKGHRVTVKEGYKNIEDIKAGDVVLTSKGRYKKVYKTQKRQHRGYMYNIKVYGLSDEEFNVTPVHPFLVAKRSQKNERNKSYETEWVEAQDLKEKDYLVVPLIPHSNAQETSRTFSITYRGVKEDLSVKLCPEFFRLIGYYLAEGCIEERGYLKFSFNINEMEFVNDIKNIIEKLFKHTKFHEFKYKDRKGIELVISSAKIARIFKEFGTLANKKSIPAWVMESSEENKKNLIVGYFRGDGNYYNKKNKHGLKEIFRMNTVSLYLALGMRDILLSLGIVAFLNKRLRGKENRQDMYTIGVSGEFLIDFGKLVGIEVQNSLNNKKRVTKFFIDTNYAYLPIKSISKHHVANQTVYNFSVLDDESYVCNGVAVHNCTAPVYSSDSLHSAVVEVIVKPNARFRYTTIQNWSNNVYNLVTKRARVEKDGVMEWIDGNLGSKLTMKYPSCYLVGEGAHGEVLSIAYASKNQHQDAGAKMVHTAPNTTSTIISKSVSVNGGRSSYRGLVSVTPSAKNVKSRVECDALILDEESRSDTYPTMLINESSANIEHEATVSKIGEEKLFYLMSRGLTEIEAMSLIVSGFIEPIVKELPLEYAVELNRLIELEMEGSVG